MESKGEVTTRERRYAYITTPWLESNSAAQDRASCDSDEGLDSAHSEFFDWPSAIVLVTLRTETGVSGDVLHSETLGLKGSQS